jgi:hypothetical protein
VSAAAVNGGWTIGRIGRLLGQVTSDDRGTVERFFEALPAEVRHSLIVPTATIDALDLTDPQKAIFFDRRMRVEHGEAVRSAERRYTALGEVFAAAAAIAKPSWLAKSPAKGDRPRDLNGDERALVDAYIGRASGKAATPTLEQAYRLWTGLMLVVWRYEGPRWPRGRNMAALLDPNGNELRVWRPAAADWGKGWPNLYVLPDSSFGVHFAGDLTFFDPHGHRRWSEKVRDNIWSLGLVGNSGIVELSYNSNGHPSKIFHTPDGQRLADSL